MSVKNSNTSTPNFFMYRQESKYCPKSTISFLLIDIAFKNRLKNHTHYQQGLMKATKYLVLLLVATLMLSSCKYDPAKVFDKKINVAIRSGNNIDEKEWNDLTQHITDNKAEFANFLEGEAASTKKLTDYIIAFSQEHKRGGQTDPEIFNPKTTAESSIKSQVKFFY